MGRSAARPGLIRSAFGRPRTLFERVYVEMTPGSTLFFHCNLLHSSGPNNSENHRRSFIMCYNALGNPQLTEQKFSEQRPCPVSPDNAILETADKILTAAR